MVPIFKRWHCSLVNSLFQFRTCRAGQYWNRLKTPHLRDKGLATKVLYFRHAMVCAGGFYQNLVE